MMLVFSEDQTREGAGNLQINDLLMSWGDEPLQWHLTIFPAKSMVLLNRRKVIHLVDALVDWLADTEVE